MIAKLICWGADREQAFTRAEQALGELHVQGVPTARALYGSLLACPELRKGTVHTSWLEAWLE
ncbi:hypothetical protein [Saccharopolyspora pogona]|uniref:hypothetical protein n=1 Tax=Saccharopolyspora pogona TaxID=333966 RepID=UPI0021E0B284|nr:hypothetical protein [Saccharopolyspora pogona]